MFATPDARHRRELAAQGLVWLSRAKRDTINRLCT